MKTEFRMQNAECGMLKSAARYRRRKVSSDHRMRSAERGVALVITLIMLAVITFMAITFLVVSRSDKGSVTVQTDQAIARLATETAAQRAQAEMAAAIMAWTNPFNYGLFVSTNYINEAGFRPGNSDYTNVNYDFHITDGGGLSGREREQNIANLFYNPRPPVYVLTNASVAASNEFRYFLNLNRNTDFSGIPRFDPTGWLAVTNKENQGPPLPTGATNYFVGDPQWIGGLEHPDYPHSATNLFAYRYAYLVVPAGQTLDVNTIHNWDKFLSRSSMAAAPDGFVRNQGILTSEMNLAGLLTDLNTNLWPTTVASKFGFFPYFYQVDPFQPNNLSLPNTGAAFDDAVGLLTYRYNNNLRSLANVSQLFGVPGRDAFTGPLDVYSAGPLMAGTVWPPPGFVNPNQTRVTQNDPWSSSANPIRFFTPQDFFDERKTAANIPRVQPTTWTFTKRLVTAGTNDSSYDRYTFYRLLSQLGTDSAPEPESKMNLNFRNVDTNGYVVPNMVTNFLPWNNPAQFFTNAAIRLLVDAGYTVGAPSSTSNLLIVSSNNVNGRWLAITNLHIPIWPTNLYTPSVQRILQLAANLYDATTNRADLLAAYPNLPTIFRPVFTDTRGGRGNQGQVSVTGYSELTNDTRNFVANLVRFHDLADPTDTTAVRPFDMVYNVPLVIGARKGYPNFDELAMNTQIQVTRKLQYQRPGTGVDASPNELDQMYLLTVTNVLGISAWNSYASAFPRNLRIYVWPDVRLMLTNLESGRWLNPSMPGYQTPTNLPILANQWKGYGSNTVFASVSFQTPLGSPTTPYVIMPTNAIYRLPPVDQFQIGDPRTFTRTPGTTNLHTPWLQLAVRARLRFALVDELTGRLVDYVDLASQSSFADLANSPDTALRTYTNLTWALAYQGRCGEPYTQDTSENDKGSFFCPQRKPGQTNDYFPTYGIYNQLAASSTTHPSLGWDATAVAKFKAQFGLGALANVAGIRANAFQAMPVSRNLSLYTVWKVNDPLVHYTVGDMADLVAPKVDWDQAEHDPCRTLGQQPNSRYEPWGNRPGKSATVGAYDWRFKDPVPSNQGSSDYWDPPTNKFPNIGWVGRMHRGTPWQTVYLKSTIQDVDSWANWTGNNVLVTNIGQFPTNMSIPSTAAYIWTTRGLLRPATATVNFSNTIVVRDAYFTMPTNDWHFLDLFSTALDANATRGQLSINQTNLAAWSAALSGVMVLTNAGAIDAVTKQSVLTPTVIPPAGSYDSSAAFGTWPAVAKIVYDINRTRTNFTGGVFRRLGDLLAVSALTTNSPFLNTASPNLLNYTLNDAAAERIPQQILGLLKADAVPRAVIYAYGQTLKPAPHSIVTAGPFFGLCTNYQVTAEMATRTVVRFEGVPVYQRGVPLAITNLYPVVESFNVLPAD
jgi:hypothetical protein